MQVKFDEKQQNFVITIPAAKTPELSASGKSFVLAKTDGGFVETTERVNGSTVRANINLIIANPEYKAARKRSA